MAAAAIALYCVWFGLAFGVRIAVQWRRTGSPGVHGVSAGAGPLVWFAGALFVGGLATSAAAPVLAVLDVVEALEALDGAVVHVVGIVLAATGIVLTFLAQLAMGDEWRIGVDPKERTRLLTDGPFKLVRNPIYSAMVPTVLGLALIVPSVVAIVGLLALVIGLELQVRLVEEPHLLRTHSDEYAGYAARVGRFVPGVGVLHGVR